MEIKLNGGKGPTVEVGTIALVQVVVAVSTFIAAMKVAQRDIVAMEEVQRKMSQKIELTLESQRVMEAQIKVLVEELKYYRERLDRHIETTSGGRYVTKDK